MNGPGRDDLDGGWSPKRGARAGDGLADVVDLSTRRGFGLGSQKAAWDTRAVLDGSVAGRPIVIFCHLMGERPPFPTRWRWGQLTIGAGQPEWRRWSLRRGPAVTIPKGTVVVETPRPIMRNELSASCPNPRRSLVVPLRTPDGPLLIGVPRQSAPTVVAVFGWAPGTPSAPESPAAPPFS